MAPTPQSSRPSETNAPTRTTSHSYVGWIILALILAGLLSYVTYIILSTLRARRLGLPPPSWNPLRRNPHHPTSNYPARGGPLGWLGRKWTALTNRRTAGGAYEGAPVPGQSSSRAARGGRGFGALDPDEAWDARVGNEADDMYGYSGGGAYEEQELGSLQRPLATREAAGEEDDAYGYGPAGGLEEIELGGGGSDGRGRSRAREELDRRYEEEVGGGGERQKDPFGDDAEASSLRGVSPRPHEEELPRRAGGSGVAGHQTNLSVGSDESPTERRSMFREDV